MARSVSSAPVFRQSFTTKCKEMTAWFPRHMFTGLKQMQAKLKMVDCIIEVHDARIPFSGRNPLFYNLLTAILPHILVLTKTDLTNTSTKFDVIKTLKSETRLNEVIYVNTKDQSDKGIRKILPKAIELIKSSSRYNRETSEDFMIMAIGIPNVGKSSVINCLRAKYMKRSKATVVGATPGVTKSVLEKIKIHEDPNIYLLDTPGITSPNVKDAETGLKLALCAVLQDHVVGEQLIADYLLYWLNKNENFSYVDFFKLPEPCDDITKVLLHISLQAGLQQKIRSMTDGCWYKAPNLHAAAIQMIRSFREGNLGAINLDSEIIATTKRRIEKSV